MEIHEFRVVLRAKDFDHTCRFYRDVLTFSRIREWHNERERRAMFGAGTTVIEIVGFTDGDGSGYQGPEHKIAFTVIVPSAEEVYEELIFREKNIPGGLLTAADGTLVFETNDPDGVKVRFVEAG